MQLRRDLVIVTPDFVVDSSEPTHDSDMNDVNVSMMISGHGYLLLTHTFSLHNTASFCQVHQISACQYNRDTDHSLLLNTLHTPHILISSYITIRSNN